MLRAESHSRVWLFATPYTAAVQASLSVEFSRQEYWSGLPCPPPRGLPNPGIKPVSLRSPALAGVFFTSSTTWKALEMAYMRPCALGTQALASSCTESVQPESLSRVPSVVFSSMLPSNAFCPPARRSSHWFFPNIILWACGRSQLSCVLYLSDIIWFHFFQSMLQIPLETAQKIFQWFSDEHFYTFTSLFNSYEPNL